MDASLQGIRKAAVFVASLDKSMAEEVLVRLTPTQAQRLRQVLVDMESIDPREQRRVIDEFFHACSMVPERQPPGIELDRSPARKWTTPITAPTVARSDPAPAPDKRPFRFLCDAEADKLARVLGGERPQTIALVLSHLPAERAGSVLVRFQPGLQVEVIHRLVDLDETDPAILREVERVLESRLSEQVRIQRRRVAGMQALSGILEVCDGGIATQILNNLAAHDPSLADRLRPPAVAFNDLMNLSDVSLRVVLRAADMDVMTTAMVGALPELVDRLLARLPVQEAETIRHRLDHPGPLRLSDVEEARRQIAELVRDLALEGHIPGPGSQGDFAKRLTALVP